MLQTEIRPFEKEEPSEPATRMKAVKVPLGSQGPLRPRPFWSIMEGLESMRIFQLSPAHPEPLPYTAKDDTSGDFGGLSAADRELSLRVLYERGVKAAQTLQDKSSVVVPHSWPKEPAAPSAMVSQVCNHFGCSLTAHNLANVLHCMQTCFTLEAIIMSLYNELVR